MGRKMESKEAMREGSVAEGGKGPAVRFLPSIEQFHTRSCARCSGLLVNEWYYDSTTIGEHNVEILRCVQCGHRVDPMILQNQIRPTIENQRVRQVRLKSSTRTAVLSEVV